MPGLLLALDLVLIIAVAHLGGALAVRLRQPRIVGEMVGVVCLGPTVLGGTVAGVVRGQEASGLVGALFPESAVTVLSVVGALGLALYMLLVGMTIDARALRRHAGAVALLAAMLIGSVVVLALVIAPRFVDAGDWKPVGVSDAAFVLALAAGLAANGVPIVARILEERELLRTEVGAIVIVAATTVTVLSLVAAAVAIDGADLSAGTRVTVRLVAGVGVLLLVLAIAHRSRVAPRGWVLVVAVLALAMLSALAGDELISSTLIGPLVVGVAVPARGVTARVVEQRVGVVVRRVLLPVFLGVAALHTDLGALGPSALALVLVTIAAVIVVKLAAGYSAARLAGFARGERRAIGALLQCGGIMTIAISLAVLQAGVISSRMHATLTLVGLVTTLVTGPLLTRARLVAPAPIR